MLLILFVPFTHYITMAIAIRQAQTTNFEALIPILLLAEGSERALR